MLILYHYQLLGDYYPLNFRIGFGDSVRRFFIVPGDLHIIDNLLGRR
jgi:hypothetical protein